MASLPTPAERHRLNAAGICPWCRGTGFVPRHGTLGQRTAEPCRSCGGSGVPEERWIRASLATRPRIGVEGAKRLLAAWRAEEERKARQREKTAASRARKAAGLPRPSRATLTDEERRRQHAAAQERYRQKQRERKRKERPSERSGTRPTLTEEDKAKLAKRGFVHPDIPDGPFVPLLGKMVKGCFVPKPTGQPPWLLPAYEAAIQRETAALQAHAAEEKRRRNTEYCRRYRERKRAE